MADQVLDACEAWTGERPVACPWRALADPFVQRVLDAYPFFKTGNLASAYPRLTQRLTRGLAYYHRALGSAEVARWRADHPTPPGGQP